MAKSEKQKRKEYYQEYWRKRCLVYEDEKRGPYYVKYRTHSTPTYDWITRTFVRESEAKDFKEQLQRMDKGVEVYIQSREALEMAKMRKQWREQEIKEKRRIENRNVLTFIWHLLIGILFSIMFTAVGASLCLIAWFLVNAGSHDGPEIFIFSFLVAFAPIACIAGVVIIIRSVFTLIGNISMVIIAYKEKKPIEYSAIFD